MHRKCPVLTVKKWLKSVHNYGSYRKNKTGTVFLDHPVVLIIYLIYAVWSYLFLCWQFSIFNIVAVKEFHFSCIILKRDSVCFITWIDRDQNFCALHLGCGFSVYVERGRLGISVTMQLDSLIVFNTFDIFQQLMFFNEICDMHILTSLHQLLLYYSIVLCSEPLSSFDEYCVMKNSHLFLW